MEVREKWEQTTRWLDELPATRAGLAGFVVFLCAGLLVMVLPSWGFVPGLLGLLGLLCWLALSGQPVVKLTWPVEPALPPEPLTFPQPVEPVSAMARADEPLDMLALPSGEFWMGEGTEQHRVRVSAFAMGKYPVTQKQYQEVMGENPSYFRQKQPTDERWEELPVETVSWFDAVRFCNRLSERAGLRPCYRVVEPEPPQQQQKAMVTAFKRESRPEVEWDQTANGYRLPTEAEWEYACRAGTETAYSFGDDAAQLGEHAWFNGNSEGRTHEVGTKKQNGWGLCDLHGNVWEWCWDWYAEYQVTSDNAKSVSLVGPIGPPSGDVRVLRGGSFFSEPRFLRSANRSRFEPGVQGRFLGFRCVRGSGRQP